MSRATFTFLSAPASSVQAPAFSSTLPTYPHTPSFRSQKFSYASRPFNFGAALSTDQDLLREAFRCSKRKRVGVGNEYGGRNLQPRKRMKAHEGNNKAVFELAYCLDSPKDSGAKDATKADFPKSANSTGLPTPPNSPHNPDLVIDSSLSSLPKEAVDRRSPLLCPVRGDTPVLVSSQQPVLPTLSCDHPRHPAYAGKYNNPLCPRCLMLYSLSNLEGIQDWIKDKGGIRQWRESTRDPAKSPSEQQEEHNRYQMATQGGYRRNKQHVLVNDYGHDVSYRHCKKRLINLLPQFRKLKKVEEEWTHGMTNVGAEGWCEYTAHAALEQYRARKTAGMLRPVEDLDMAFARKRGREHEVATNTNYPEDKDENDQYTHAYNQKSLAQALFLSDCKVAADPDVTTVAVQPEQHPLKRQRRNSNAKVSFAGKGEVCLVRDIDDIRKLHAARPKIVTHYTPSFGPGILRTAKPEVGAHLNSAVVTIPQLPYYHVSLRPVDLPRRQQARYLRSHAAYKPETCEHKASEGHIIVDTSGSKDLQEGANEIDDQEPAHKHRQPSRNETEHSTDGSDGVTGTLQSRAQCVYSYQGCTNPSYIVPPVFVANYVS